MLLVLLVSTILVFVIIPVVMDIVAEVKMRRLKKLWRARKQDS